MAGQYHEPRDELGTHTVNIKRAIDSMMEELEAVDWYRQRAAVTDDETLREILLHHQREEIEHFSMLLEWMRRNDEDFAAQLRDYLFSDGDLVAAEREATGEPGTASEAPEEPEVSRATNGRTIGSLKEES